MMSRPKCVMVKIGRSKKRKLSKRYANFMRMRGEFINFAEIGREHAICIIGLLG